VHGRILPSVTFKREDAKLLSLSEPVKLRKNSEDLNTGREYPFDWKMNEREFIQEVPRSVTTVRFEEGIEAFLQFSQIR
jgi:hypothetical protein